MPGEKPMPPEAMEAAKKMEDKKKLEGGEQPSVTPEPIGRLRKLDEIPRLPDSLQKLDVSTTPVTEIPAHLNTREIHLNNKPAIEIPIEEDVTEIDFGKSK